MKILLLFIGLVFLFSGCSTKGVKAYKQQKQLSKIPLTKVPKTTKKVEPKYKPQHKSWVTSALYKEYKKWYGTPYRYGGVNFNGVDCSSFVQNVYFDAFNIRLPRTTKNQVKKGYFVKRDALKEGDLLFFRTSLRGRHTGILIEKDKFIHASAKYGVTVSSIHNPYWRRKYWQARRILILE